MNDPNFHIDDPIFRILDVITVVNTMVAIIIALLK